ncbi:hypothetical protein NIA69_21955 [Gemmiger formicilis]|nr:hypothetical protein [Gemmiger formicilis]
MQQAAPVPRLPSAASGWRRLPRSPAAQSMRMPRSPQPISPAPPQAAMAAAASPRAMRTMPRTRQRAESPAKGRQRQGRKREKKKKIRWWQILLITLLVIALIFGGAFALIMGAITPAGGNIKLNQLINTPKEFQGKEFNILVTGVDRSSTGDLSAGAANDSNVNDGMTDMILYVHFNNETGEMKMLQIPRDTMVTTDTSVSKLPHQRRGQDPGQRRQQQHGRPV